MEPSRLTARSASDRDIFYFHVSPAKKRPREKTWSSFADSSPIIMFFIRMQRSIEAIIRKNLEDNLSTKSYYFLIIYLRGRVVFSLRARIAYELLRGVTCTICLHVLQHTSTSTVPVDRSSSPTLRDGLKLTSPGAAHCSYSDRPPTSTRQTEQTWPAAAAPSASASWPPRGPKCQPSRGLPGATRAVRSTRRRLRCAPRRKPAAGGASLGVLESWRLHRLPLCSLVVRSLRGFHTQPPAVKFYSREIK